MIIHVIQPDDTINSIADYYGVSSEWIIRENGIVDPSDLAVGGALVILYPKVTHTIIEGDTLENIANIYSVSTMDLLRNNSYLSYLEFLRIGDTIVIEYEDEKIRNLTVIGYTYPFIEENILRKTLPYLTYLMIYSFVVELDGSLRALDDARTIEYAKNYGVAPIMIFTFATDENITETDIAHIILNNEELRNSIIEDIISDINQKGYLGISISPIYVYPSDRILYVEFMQDLIERVRDLGLIVLDTIVPNTLTLLSDVFIIHDYIRIVNEFVDSNIIFPISVGLRQGDPTGTTCYDVLQSLVEYYLQHSSADIFKLGINIVGYMWKLPYIPGVSESNPISIASAIQLAKDYDIPILYDEGSRRAYYIFQDNEREYLIRFLDVRSINSHLNVVSDFDLNGIGVWNIMPFFNGLWLIVNSQYYIDKVEI